MRRFRRWTKLQIISAALALAIFPAICSAGSLNDAFVRKFAKEAPPGVDLAEGHYRNIQVQKVDGSTYLCLDVLVHGKFEPVFYVFDKTFNPLPLFMPKNDLTLREIWRRLRDSVCTG